MLVSTGHRLRLKTSVCGENGLTGLLPVLQLEISSHRDVTTALVMSDSCCTHSWVSAGLAPRLNLTGQKLDILVNGFNSTESVPTQQVEVNVFVKFDQHEYSFRVTPFVKDSLSVGSETNDVPILQDRFPHLQPVKPFIYNYSDVEMILGQDVFHAIKPLEYFQGRNQNTAVAVRMPIGWVLSGPLLLPIGNRATTFKCNVEDVPSADQVKKWYELGGMARLNKLIPVPQLINVHKKFFTLPRFMMAAVMLSECSEPIPICLRN